MVPDEEVAVDLRQEEILVKVHRASAAVSPLHARQPSNRPSTSSATGLGREPRRGALEAAISILKNHRQDDSRRGPIRALLLRRRSLETDRQKPITVESSVRHPSDALNMGLAL
jgi:hypothetical protein